MAYSDLFAIFSLGGTDIRGWLKYILSRFQFAYAECLSDSGASSGGGGRQNGRPQVLACGPQAIQGDGAPADGPDLGSFSGGDG